jgi:hypothetical protein
LSTERYSYVQYAGDGETTDFAVPFGYISRDNVEVTVGGLDADFTWLDAYTVRLSPAPSSAAAVVIRRETPIEAPVVDFQGGSTLTEEDLDNSTKQVLYVAQETRDIVNSFVGSQSSGGDILLAERVKPSGDFEGGAWRPRNINAVVYDPSGVGVEVNGDGTFTLPAGTYLVEGEVPAGGNAASTHMGRIYNITTDAAILHSKAGQWAEEVPAGMQTYSKFLGAFTLAATSVLRLDQRSAFTGTYGTDASGWGKSSAELVYSWLKLRKVS